MRAGLHKERERARGAQEPARASGSAAVGLQPLGWEGPCEQILGVRGGKGQKNKGKERYKENEKRKKERKKKKEKKGKNKRKKRKKKGKKKKEKEKKEEKKQGKGNKEK